MSENMMQQEEHDFHVLTKAEAIKADKMRLEKAVKFGEHAKKVYGSIEEMEDDYLEEKATRAKKAYDGSPESEDDDMEDHPLAGKNDPSINKDAIQTKLIDKKSAQDDEEMGTNGPTGEKINDELPSKKKAMKEISRKK